MFWFGFLVVSEMGVTIDIVFVYVFLLLFVKTVQELYNCQRFDVRHIKFS